MYALSPGYPTRVTERISSPGGAHVGVVYMLYHLGKSPTVLGKIACFRCYFLTPEETSGLPWVGRGFRVVCTPWQRWFGARILTCCDHCMSGYPLLCTITPASRCSATHPRVMHNSINITCGEMLHMPCMRAILLSCRVDHILHAVHAVLYHVTNMPC
jgi:hypothetical protein